ncbi:MAG: hypothetical protein AAF696_36475, partial [Bacteroidota bacterium]
MNSINSISLFKGKNYKIFKRVLIGVAIFLAIADVYFLSDKNPYSTISKVVLYSTPKYLVSIWLFGFFSSHFFF